MMIRRFLRRFLRRTHGPMAIAALLFGMFASVGAQADSFASSASSAGSASIGSSSDSIKGSSNSSSGDKKVADGDYRVIEVGAVPDRPGLVRLRLQGQASSDQDAPAFLLDLPQKALGAQGMAAGELVSVRNRPYGVEFARALQREAFFLVLDDGWRGDLDAHPVAF